MSLCVNANLIIKGLVLCQTFANVGNLDSQIELLDLHRVQVELSLLRLNVFLCDGFAKEFARVQELLEQESGKFAKNFDTLNINVFKIVLAWLLFLFAFFSLLCLAWTIFVIVSLLLFFFSIWKLFD